MSSPQKDSQKDFSLLLHITGPDRPGITAMLTEHLAKSQSEMLTMGQYVTHGLLSLSILVKTNSTNTDLLKNILFVIVYLFIF